MMYHCNMGYPLLSENAILTIPSTEISGRNDIYADGKLYFNAGIPELRTFVADGVREIVEKYDVDGVVFDDYFYPYPVAGL